MDLKSINLLERFNTRKEQLAQNKDIILERFANKEVLDEYVLFSFAQKLRFPLAVVFCL